MIHKANHMIIYGIKNCNTMQKAFERLDEKDIPYTFHDYKKAGIAEAKIREWFSKAPWERFINRQGLTWKKLDESVKSGITGEKAALELMMKHTSLIRRPILETGSRLVIGLDEEAYSGL